MMRRDRDGRACGWVLATLVVSCFAASTHAAPEICDDQRDNDGDGYVDAFDVEDCRTSVVCTVEDEPTPIRLVERYESPGELLFLAPFAFSDSDGDGRTEIIGSDGRFSTDSRNRVVQSEIPKSGFMTNDNREFLSMRSNPENGIAVAELDDSSPGAEFVTIVADQQRLFIMPANGGGVDDALASAGILDDEFLSATPTIADLDGDGAAEVIVGNGVFAYDPLSAPYLTAIAQPTVELPSGSSPFVPDGYPGTKSIFNTCAEVAPV